MNRNEIAIKWSGSKSSQSDEIVSHFPKKIGTYYEPFCGGASVLYTLLNSDIECQEYVISDKNQDLINLWNCIKIDYKAVSKHYEKQWTIFNEKDIAWRKEFYNNVRSNFNEVHNALDFMFLMRTCINGMPRYNSKGDFNSPCHFSRSGIQPEKLDEILRKWSFLLNSNNVRIICQSYDEISPKEGDYVYLDPPYANTKGMYYGGIDLDRFFSFVESLKCQWSLSFDGISGDENNTYDVPMIYDEHLYIKSGNSSFKRIVGNSKDSIVYESLYKKYNR